jgi:hypothetical protein
MKTRIKIVVLLIFAAAMSAAFLAPRLMNISESTVFAQTTPTPAVVEFDQKAAIAKLREQIKGRETEPASAVFKNIQTAFLKTRPAGQLLAVMEIAYSRSLGVNCTHCHVPDKWESDEKPTKPIAREMSAMMLRINAELLKPIKNLKSENPVINCTTCHRGEVKPALNLPTPRS